MRPIDGDYISDALEAELCREGDDLEDRQWAYGYAAGVSFAVRKLAEAPTLTLPNEWVSAENAMPAEHKSVLCIVSGKPRPNITLEEAYQLGSWNKADGWIIDEYLDWEDAVVLWWMPLPEPLGKEG